MITLIDLCSSTNKIKVILKCFFFIKILIKSTHADVDKNEIFLLRGRAFVVQGQIVYI